MENSDLQNISLMFTSIDDSVEMAGYANGYTKTLNELDELTHELSISGIVNKLDGYDHKVKNLLRDLINYLKKMGFKLASDFSNDEKLISTLLEKVDKYSGEFEGQEIKDGKVKKFIFGRIGVYSAGDGNLTSDGGIPQAAMGVKHLSESLKAFKNILTLSNNLFVVGEDAINAAKKNAKVSGAEKSTFMNTAYLRDLLGKINDETPRALKRYTSNISMNVLTFKKEKGKFHTTISKTSNLVGDTAPIAMHGTKVVGINLHAKTCSLLVRSYELVYDPAMKIEMPKKQTLISGLKQLKSFDAKEYIDTVMDIVKTYNDETLKAIEEINKEIIDTKSGIAGVLTVIIRRILDLNIGTCGTMSTVLLKSSFSNSRNFILYVNKVIGLDEALRGNEPTVPMIGTPTKMDRSTMERPIKKEAS